MVTFAREILSNFLADFIVFNLMKLWSLVISYHSLSLMICCWAY